MKLGFYQISFTVKFMYRTKKFIDKYKSDEILANHSPDLFNPLNSYVKRFPRPDAISSWFKTFYNK